MSRYLLQLVGRSGSVRNLELDTSLRYRNILRPVRGTDAGGSSFGERPETEMLRALEPVGVLVVAAPASLERQTERIFVERSRCLGVADDRRMLATNRTSIEHLPSIQFEVTRQMPSPSDQPGV